ncbi:MAG: cysteine--tRNA ligase [Thermoplasmatales archaeon]|nr:cysteine--tRNA ligase [Thermoplasmatales archaeon]
MLKIFNTLSRKKEIFIPLEGKRVRMYVCGITTYSDAHIGHARTYVAFDIIRRYLEYKGYDVFYVQNITDIDDKIIDAANKAGMPAPAYADMYAKRCFEDMKKLGIREASFYPKATEHVEDMIDFIKKLIDEGYAYLSDGDVYFSVKKFEGYGILSRQNMQEIMAGARVSGEGKINKEDFALWKSAKPNEPKWRSPWGDGRPGWHIECSVMSSKYLGVPIDIHGGGEDLIFPHHENEIAQSEAFYGRRFVNYWLHCGLLKIRGEKMSKSLGNIINLRDAIDEWGADNLRFFFASYHYRSPADFSEEGIENASNSLKKIIYMKEKLDEFAGESKKLRKKDLSKEEKNYLEEIKNIKMNFEKAMDDDFNTPKAVEEIFNFVRATNRFLMEEKKPKEEICRFALDEFLSIASVLNIFKEERKIDESSLLLLAERYGIKEKKSEKIIEKIIEIRKEARENKNYKLADEIRDDLRNVGIELEDIGKETKWKII